MPLYDYRCLDGCIDECYYHTSDHAPLSKTCRLCGQEAQRLPSLFATLNYFSESNGQVINNLAPGVKIHSHAQHQALMKAKGLEPATEWHTSNMKRTNGLPPRSDAARRDIAQQQARATREGM